MSDFLRVKDRIADDCRKGNERWGQLFRHEDYRTIWKLVDGKKLTEKQKEAICRLYLEWNYVTD